MTKRIDQILVDLKFFTSRTKAQSAIAEGLVFINDEVVKKPSMTFNAEEITKEGIKILSGMANRYVSRGGIKLAGALMHLNLSVVDKVVLDVGSSTGGFVDCLLQSGAQHVVGVDVGSDQLHETLRGHSRVTNLEKTNIKDLSSHQLTHVRAPIDFELIVGDVSFISLRQVLPSAVRFLRTQGELLFLVKPQFELSAKQINKSGLVKDKGKYKDVEKGIKDLCKELNLTVIDYFASGISGGDGNKEFFVYAKRN